MPDGLPTPLGGERTPCTLTAPLGAPAPFTELDSPLTSVEPPVCLHPITTADLPVGDPFETVPVHRLAYMQQLLRNEHQGARVVLLAGFYSVGLAAQYEQLGFIVISCDLRYPEQGGGMHYRGDIRSILYARHWAVIVAAPPCKNLAWATTDQFPEKQRDGRQFRAVAFALLLWTASADAVVLEQGRSELARFLGPPSQIFHPRDLQGGLGEKKTFFLWIRGTSQRVELDGSGEGAWERSHNIRDVDPNTREIERARWPDAVNRGVATAVNPDTVVPSDGTGVPQFAEAMQYFIAQWVGLERPLPEGFDDVLARAPAGDEAAHIATTEGVPKLVPEWLQLERQRRRSANDAMQASMVRVHDAANASRRVDQQQRKTASKRTGSPFAQPPPSQRPRSVTFSTEPTVRPYTVCADGSRANGRFSASAAAPPPTPPKPQSGSSSASAPRAQPRSESSSEGGDAPPAGASGISEHRGVSSERHAAPAPNVPPPPINGHRASAPRAQPHAGSSSEGVGAPPEGVVGNDGHLGSAADVRTASEPSDMPQPIIEQVPLHILSNGAAGDSWKLANGTVIVIPMCRTASGLVMLAPASGPGEVLAVPAFAPNRERAKSIAVSALAFASPDFSPDLTIVMRWHGAHVVIVVSASALPSDAEVVRAGKPTRIGPGEQLASPSPEPRWFEQDAVRQLAQHQLFSDCFRRIVQLQAPSAAAPDKAEIGASGECFAAAHIESDAAPTDADALRARADASVSELQGKLKHAAERADSTGERDFLLQWAASCKPLPESLPDGWREACKEFDDPTLAQTPFVRRCIINPTPPAEHPTEQPPLPADANIQGKRDILTESAIRKIGDKLKAIQHWHAERRAGREALRPAPLALGKEAFKCDYWRWVWDLRGEKPVPAAMQGKAVESKFVVNGERLVQLLDACVDKELLSFIRAGVLMKADLEPQIVIFPSLLSLYNVEGGVDAVATEYGEQQRRGWYTMNDFIPFAPWRAAPRGAVPRKDGGPPRGIVDEGQPRKELSTERSEPVVPLNEACKLDSDDFAEYRKWYKEIKPFFADAAVAGSVLRSAADILGQPVYTIAFDFRYFFMQMTYCKSELWKAGSLMPEAEPEGKAGAVRAMTEHVMAMGFTASSQIAQRLANALVQLFSLLAEDADAAFTAADAQHCERFQFWLDQRRALSSDQYGSHARLFEMLMYTDDPLAVIVGADRVVRALKLWYSIIGPAGGDFEFAKAHKWQIGVHALWLGGHLCPALGIAWISADRAAATIARIKCAANGALEASAWRELLGLLEHVRQIIKVDRSLMSELWHQFNLVTGEQGCSDPADVIAPCGKVVGLLRKIEHRLANTRCASLLQFVQPISPWTAQPSVVHELASDAALEKDVDFADLGGVYYGYYWYLALKGNLTIPLAEMLASGIEAITFGFLVDSALNVRLGTDALASWCALRKQHAKSRNLRVCLATLKKMAAYTKLCTPASRVTFCHIFGEGNTLADLASRAKFAKLVAAYAALGVRARRISLPQEALDFVYAVCAELNIEVRVVQGRQYEDSPKEAAQPLCLRCLRARPLEELGLGCCPCNPHGNSASHPVSLRDDSSGKAHRIALVAAHSASLSSGVTLRAAQSSAPRADAKCRLMPPMPMSASLRTPSARPAPDVPSGGLRASGASTAGAASLRPAAAAMPAATPLALAPAPLHLPSASPAHNSLSQLGGMRAPAAPSAAAAAMRSAREPRARAFDGAPQLAVAAIALLEAREQVAPAPTSRASLLHTIRTATSHADSVRQKMRNRLDDGNGAKPGSVQRRYAELRADERARRVQELVTRLRENKSEWSLHFDDDEQELEATAEFVAALDERHSAGTIVNEASNMRHWMAFCEYRRTPVMRRRRWTEGDVVHEEEVFIAAQAFLFVYSRMQPRRGFATPPRPASAVNVLRGIKRMHERLGLQFVNLTEVVAMCNSITQAYCEALGGPEALNPRRAEPMHNDEIAAVLGISDGAALGNWQYVARSRSGLSFKALTAVLAQTGFRGSEVSLTASKTFTKATISRASVTWRIGGVDVPDPSPAQLASLKEGDYVLIVPPPSKCDRFGIAWGSDPIYLAWHPLQPINAARLIQQLELAFPARGEERRTTPLFTFNNGSMFTRTWLAETMKSALRCVGVPPARLATLTIHSYRRYLACALLAMKVSEYKICALLRWRSSKSLAAYASMNDCDYAGYITSAAAATISSVRTANLGRVPILAATDVAYNMRQNARAATAAAARTDDEAARDEMCDSD